MKKRSMIRGWQPSCIDTIPRGQPLDQDVTLVATAKRDALFSYQGFKSYQLLNTWWSEQQMVLHTEFRDGNVPAGYDPLRVLKESLSLLPEGIEQVRLRSNTAGYQYSLLRYCERGEDRRFGRIEFAVGADVNPEFKKAVLTEVEDNDWKPICKEFDGKGIQTNQEWAEVCFVPSAIGHRIPGRIVERSRELIIRLVKGHPALELNLEARRRIMAMIPAPG